MSKRLKTSQQQKPNTNFNNKKIKSSKEGTSTSNMINIGDELSKSSSGKSLATPCKEILITAGTYERLLYGITGKWNAKHDKIDLMPIFILPAHTGCIKTISIGGRYLATGSTDETIKIYDIKKLREMGSLHHHSGTITCVKFHGQPHLLTTSEDGTISILRSKDWEVLKTLKGHKSTVNSFDVHPSGKMALSVSKDRLAIVWNLMNGRKASKTKLYREGEIVQWSPEGDAYAIVTGNEIYLYKTADAAVYSVIKHTHSITSIKYIKDSSSSSPEDLLVVGSQSKLITVYKADKSGTLVKSWVAHENRIKDVSTIEISDPSSELKSKRILVTASSDGKIKVWDFDSIINSNNDGEKRIDSEEDQYEPLGLYDADCRLTVVNASSNITGK
ncbi:60s ribosome biogenesis protein mak11 [Mycoemilia scoparia]|uniref:60s ribosome biogenesis protein mak11 n=1 Tax=Mycoemilia scoparia TaxID=417184 RepID=A0A9W7ZVV0_9FUNG|nr:60s ribosome biogenesis protein mak11 [Mycoemilia scoparia]